MALDSSSRLQISAEEAKLNVLQELADAEQNNLNQKKSRMEQLEAEEQERLERLRLLADQENDAQFRVDDLHQRLHESNNGGSRTLSSNSKEKGDEGG